ncbi:thioether cross-link-forming SCIFF peptide maturase [Desulfolucanica intricata]|uniref:thioether cross-link-forming SCIFF peptide maturase n=1 Tax=Desulfolucanica intricata TaxID=1285191 RepID=UPI00082DCDA3|nr:thioether cross-link-forming SCIFF peptide maturase [Desulfolucanica intricata]
MIHKFTIDGTNIVLDVNSSAVHVVDDLIMRLLDDYRTHDRKMIIQKYIGRYPEKEILEALDEIEQLEKEGLLFSADPLHGTTYNPPADGVVKALCLHLAHDCNLRCRYCFAGQGKFGGDAGLMSLEVGKKALEFLMSKAGNRRHVEVDFFGGEPLMNFKVLQELVVYGLELAESRGKKIKFTVTTNGLLLNPAVEEFLNNHNISTVLSLDGRPEVHDYMRRTPGGEGSYKYILPNFQRFVASRKHDDYYIRGTFTHHNLDFSKDVFHMAELGFISLSVEPVIAAPGESYAFQEQDIPVLFEEYEKLARGLLEYYRQGKELSFFHYNIDLDGGPCLPKRLTGCGAGCEYLAVAPDGEIYPCHQFVGRKKYLLGNVFDGIRNNEVIDQFRQAHIYNKPECMECWAKFYCSGGCHANAEAFNQTLYKPYALACVLARKRIECALYVKARMALES